MNSLWSSSLLLRQPFILENISRRHCDDLLASLPLLADIPDRIRVHQVCHPDSNFTSYEFDFSCLDPVTSQYSPVFNYLLDLYRRHGFKSPWPTVESCHRSADYGNPSWLNPLVFVYRLPARFGWHAHSARYQKFQLVLNLSRQGRDYRESLFEIAYNKNISWKFTSEHSQGTIMSFPYPFAHRVTGLSPCSSHNSIQYHVHMLMPIHPKGGFKGAFIPLSTWPDKPLLGSLPVQHYKNHLKS